VSYVLRLPPKLPSVPPPGGSPVTDPAPAPPAPSTPAPPSVAEPPAAPEDPSGEAAEDAPRTHAAQGPRARLLPVVAMPEYEVIRSSERAEAIAAALLTASVVALDIETFAAWPTAGKDAALDCNKNRVRLVQLAARDLPVAVLDVLALGGLPDGIRRLLLTEKIQKVGFNIRFDARNLLHHFGVEVLNPVDLLAGAVLAHGYQDHQSRGSHTLQRLVELYLSQILPKEQAASDWGGSALTREQLDYAARDAAVLLPLYEMLRAAVERRGVTAAWSLENGCIPPVVSMEEAGLDVDRTRLEALVEGWSAEAATSAHGVARTLGPINLNSPKQVIAAVQRSYGITLTSTSESAIAEHAPSAPALCDLLTHRRAKKRIDAARVFIDAAQPDGRVRARFNPLAAPTGRFGCSSPNLLAVPKDPDFRRCFVAGDGSKLVVADYAAIQLRIVADLTGDPELIRCFGSVPPIDPHRRTAAFITGKEMQEISNDERQLAKAVNFGLAFGMGARRFVQYARDSYGVVLTAEEAEIFRERFLTLYEGIREWHRRTGVEGPGSEGVRSASGRLRRLVPKDGRFPFTEFLNTPVQGTEADGVKRALALLHPRLRASGAQIVNVVHDELVVRTPSERAEEVKALVMSAMVDGMQEFVRRVPVSVEAVVADTWAKA
jgi:DNA polymerase-1